MNSRFVRRHYQTIPHSPRLCRSHLHDRRRRVCRTGSPVQGTRRARTPAPPCSRGTSRRTCPPKVRRLRGEQMAFLASLAHQKFTDPKVGELLGAVEASELVRDPESDAAANVRELRRSYDRATKIPQSLVEELARVTTAAQQAWEQAKKKNDFASFRPILDKVVELKRQEAAAVGFKEHPRRHLRRAHRGVRAGNYRRGVEEALRGADGRDSCRSCRRSSRAPKKPDTSILAREFPVDRQKVFAEAAAAAIGFDFAAGRLDTTAHPFCSGIGPGDCRITTRYNPRFFNEAFFGVLHETGHAHLRAGPARGALRHAARRRRVRSAFTSRSRGCGRIRSAAAGRSGSTSSRDCGRRFPTALADVSLDAFYFAINDVRPSFIRVEADEATYNLHIALRFELELALLSGDLTSRRLAGRVERAVQGALRAGRARRCTRLPAGHPLELRRDRLLPDLHARQSVRGPVHGRGTAN